MKKSLLLSALFIQLLAIADDQPHLYVPNATEVSFSQAAATGNLAKVKMLISLDEIRGVTLGHAIMSAAWAGHDAVCQEILKQRADDIDEEKLMKIVVRLIDRHLDRSFINKPMPEKDRIGSSDAAIIKSILEARGNDFDSADLRDAYQAAMRISDNSRRPMVESLTALMKKRGIEWR